MKTNPQYEIKLTEDERYRLGVVKDGIYTQRDEDVGELQSAIEEAIQDQKRQGGVLPQKSLFDNDAGMSKKEMAAFYLDNANDTLETGEEPRRLTRDERLF